MRAVITAKGNTQDALLDQRFGRCAYFVIYDTDYQSVEFIPNPNVHGGEGAGISSVRLMEEKKVEKIISGEFGLQIKNLLDSLKIQMIMVRDPEKSVGEIVCLLQNTWGK